MSPENRYGPFREGLDQTERGKQLRSMGAIAHLQLGPRHPLVPELRAAESSPEALQRAHETRRGAAEPEAPAPAYDILCRHMAAQTARGWVMKAHAPQRQRLVRHLIACGERPVLEVMEHVEAGTPLDTALEAFCGLKPEDYRAAGVADLPIGRVKVIQGGRRR